MRVPDVVARPVARRQEAVRRQIGPVHVHHVQVQEGRSRRALEQAQAAREEPLGRLVEEVAAAPGPMRYASPRSMPSSNCTSDPTRNVGASLGSANDRSRGRSRSARRRKGSPRRRTSHSRRRWSSIGSVRASGAAEFRRHVRSRTRARPASRCGSGSRASRRARSGSPRRRSRRDSASGSARRSARPDVVAAQRIDEQAARCRRRSRQPHRRAARRSRAGRSCTRAGRRAPARAASASRRPRARPAPSVDAAPSTANASDPGRHEAGHRAAEFAERDRRAGTPHERDDQQARAHPDRAGHTRRSDAGSRRPHAARSRATRRSPLASDASAPPRRRRGGPQRTFATRAPRKTKLAAADREPPEAVADICSVRTSTSARPRAARRAPAATAAGRARCRRPRCGRRRSRRKHQRELERVPREAERRRPREHGAVRKRRRQAALSRIDAPGEARPSSESRAWPLTAKTSRPLAPRGSTSEPNWK